MPPGMVATAVMNLEVKVAQASRRHFGPIFKAGRRGLLTVLLSVTRPHAQPCFAAIWPKLWVGHRGLLAILQRVPRSPRCHRFEEACFFRVSFLFAVDIFAQSNHCWFLFSHIIHYQFWTGLVVTLARVPNWHFPPRDVVLVKENA